jgi:hypothetical protein
LTRVNEAVPSSLFEHKTQVIIRPEHEIVVAYPAEFHGLPLQRLDEQVIDFVENAKRRLQRMALEDLVRIRLGINQPAIPIET